MKISDVLRRKGNDVATVNAQMTIAQVLDELAQHDIGALVVADTAGSIVGIVSERDIVRHLRQRGAELLDTTAEEIMTRAVNTCSEDDTVDQVMRTMTDQRVRHLPVLNETGLIGIVSIGDVVKSRIDELQSATDQLEHYIVGG